MKEKFYPYFCNMDKPNSHNNNFTITTYFTQFFNDFSRNRMSALVPSSNIQNAHKLLIGGLKAMLLELSQNDKSFVYARKTTVHP